MLTKAPLGDGFCWLLLVIIIVANAAVIYFEASNVIRHIALVGTASVALITYNLKGFFFEFEGFGRNRKKRCVPPNDQKVLYLAIDCEMVGIGPTGRQSALARVSVVNWDLELVFDTYVQAMDRVTDYRTHVSGIRKKDLKGAMTFRKCRELVVELVQGKIVVGHGLENDFDALRYIHPQNQVRDTSQYQPLQRFDSGRWKARKLKQLVQQYLGNDDFQQREHDSIHDARAVMEIFHLFFKGWEERENYIR